MRKTDEFLFFWGNRDIYSNFHYSPFVHQGIKFTWSEQAVMYRKAMFFGATNIAEKILAAPTPKKCKELGRSRQIPFDEASWFQERESVYFEVLLDKFELPNLKKQLLKTGDRVLVEASPMDLVYGIGYADDHPFAEQPEKWRGLNLLGSLLMEVRKIKRRQETE